MSDKKKRVKVWASDMLGDNADLKQRLSRLKVGQKVKFIFEGDITVENRRSGIRVVFDGPGHQSDHSSPGQKGEDMVHLT